MEEEIREAAAAAPTHNGEPVAWLDPASFPKLQETMNESLGEGCDVGVLPEKYSFTTFVEELKQEYKTVEKLRETWPSTENIFSLIYQMFTLAMASELSSEVFTYYESLLTCLLSSDKISNVEAAVKRMALIAPNSSFVPKGRTAGGGFARLLKPVKRDRETDDDVPANYDAGEDGWCTPRANGEYTSVDLARALAVNNTNSFKLILDKIYTVTHQIANAYRGPLDKNEVVSLSPGTVNHDVTKTVTSRCLSIKLKHPVVLRVITEKRNQNDVYVVANSEQFRQRFGGQFPATMGSISVPKYKKMMFLEMPSAKTLNQLGETNDQMMFTVVDRIDFFVKDGHFNQKVWPLKLGGTQEIAIVTGPMPVEGDHRTYEY